MNVLNPVGNGGSGFSTSGLKPVSPGWSVCAEEGSGGGGGGTCPGSNSGGTSSSGSKFIIYYGVDVRELDDIIVFQYVRTSCALN